MTGVYVNSQYNQYNQCDRYNHVMKFILLCMALCLSGCQLSVQVVGNGAGRVQSEPAGIDCGNLATPCQHGFETQDVIRLTAVSEPGSVFVGWEGDCEGEQATCEVAMNAWRRVTARFTATQLVALDCGTPGAKAGCLTPKQTPEYYIEQSVKYFLTMDSSVDIRVIPNYSRLVARWEWAPWLMLTGYGDASMILSDIALKLNPTSYALID
jgi:hypothetical protein